MIPLFRVRLSSDTAKAVADVLAPIDDGTRMGSFYVGQGTKVDEFELLLQKELGTKYPPVTLNSCTSALDLAITLLGLKAGDECISTAATCYATSINLVNRGIKVIWADVDPNTFCMDPKSVEKLITPKTKAIFAVDWAGRLCDYKALKSFGLPVVEDAAHVWDTFIDKDVERGDIVCYSLQAIKFLTSIDGGLLVSNNLEYVEKAKLLRWYGLDRTRGASFRCTQNITEPMGTKYHMNDVNAVIGISNIPEAHASVLSHRDNAKFFINHIKNPNLTLPTWDESCSYWLFSLKVEKGTIDEFMKYLADHGIASSPVHFRNDLYDVTKEFYNPNLPGVEEFAKKQVCIPVGYWLMPEDLVKIVDVCNSWN